MYRYCIIFIVIAAIAGGMMTMAHTAVSAVPEGRPSQTWQSSIDQFWQAEFDRIDAQVRSGEKVEPGKNKNVFDEQALVLTTDRDPVEVQLRRTKALVAAVKAIPGAKGIDALSLELKGIESKVEKARQDGSIQNSMRDLFIDLRKVTRQAEFANPLLKFNDILFMGYMKPGGDYHMVDQYVGWNAKAGGGLYIIKNFKSSPKIINVLDNSTVKNGRFKGQKLVDGAFLRPDLDFDGKRIAFAWNNIADKAYHIFTVNADGSNLIQLTDGDANQGQLGLADSGHNDFDPCWLPSGRLTFLSDRRGGYGRCHGRPLMTYSLFGMKADGSDLITLSYHETNEWNPSVDRDGKIVFTRWDYIDRDDCIAHHLWTCYPDGRDARSPHGNYPLPLSYEEKEKIDGRAWRPNGEWNIRAIPDSRKYIATASGHHTHSFGQLVMIDTSIPDDGKMSQVKGITTGQDYWPDTAGDYGTAWPLNEDFYLCSYKGDIILLDRFGNRELVCPKDALPTRVDRVIHPIPLAARPKPPVIPMATYQGERASAKAPKATVSVMNVYEGDMPYPEGMTAKWLRVIQILPQLTPYINAPRMGYGTESLARIPLGIVPVEKDGSVHFKAPVGKLLYFQLLNEKGLAVRSMRSVTYVHPGEKLNCVGCHESRNTVPKKYGFPAALRRAPSDIKPEVSDGAIPFSFYRLVKPVFDAKCVSCHQSEGKGPDMSYRSLEKYAFHYPFWPQGFANGDIRDSGSRTVPGKFGAMASPLLKCLDKSHHGVELTPDEFRRITLWLDSNANEFGAYIDLDKQRKGEVVWPEIDCDPSNPLGIER